MGMYQNPKWSKTTLSVNKSVQGETIEQKIERQLTNKEPMKNNGAQAPIYTERSEGVRASTNIRTDRWEIAVEASDKIAKSYKARREGRAMQKQKKDGEPESIQGKEGTSTQQS